MRTIKEYSVFLVAGLLFCLAAVFPVSVYGNNLVENSPFIPNGFRAGPAPTEKPREPNPVMREIEFRGVYAISGEYQFNIYNKRDQKGEWVGLNDPRSSYRILSFNEENNSIQLETDGEEEQLYLKAPDNKPLAVQTAPDTTPAAPAAAPSRPNNPRITQRGSSSSGSDQKPVVRRRVVVPNRSRTSQSNTNTTQPSTTQRQQRQQNAQEIINQLSGGN